MCTGLEIAAIAAMAGGTGLQMYAQHDADKERGRIEKRARAIAAAEQERQMELARKGQLAVSENLRENAQPEQEEALDAQTKEISDLITKVTAGDYNVQGAQISGQSLGDSQVVTDLSDKLAARSAKSQQQIGAMARLGAFSNVAGLNQQRNTDVIGRLKTFGNFGQGGQQAATQAGGILMNQAANTKPDATLMAIGSLLQMGGGLGMMGAGAAAGAGGAGIGSGAGQGLSLGSSGASGLTMGGSGLGVGTPSLAANFGPTFAGAGATGSAFGGGSLASLSAPYYGSFAAPSAFSMFAAKQRPGG